MTGKNEIKKCDEVRDGIESIPEMAEIKCELPVVAHSAADDLLDEALMETFPASDPIASGKFG